MRTSTWPKLIADLCEWGYVSELVRAHSLACNGCDGDARTCLQLGRADRSETDWERTKEQASNKAAAALFAAFPNPEEKPIT
jgi:hypothetical protein